MLGFKFKAIETRKILTDITIAPNHFSRSTFSSEYSYNNIYRVRAVSTLTKQLKFYQFCSTTLSNKYTETFQRSILKPNSLSQKYVCSFFSSLRNYISLPFPLLFIVELYYVPPNYYRRELMRNELENVFKIHLNVYFRILDDHGGSHAWGPN